MTKIAILLALTFYVTVSYGQQFEGEIIYQSIYKSKIAGISTDSLNTLMGHFQKYFIKNGNFKVESNGTLYQWSLFKHSENKYYSKLSNSDTIRWTDGGSNHDSVTSSQLNKGAVKVLGYKCDELILKTTSGVKKFYFDSASMFRVDAKKFIKYISGNWYDFLTISNSLPLKTIEDDDSYIYELTAIEIKPMKLKDSFFELPPNSKVKISE